MKFKEDKVTIDGSIYPVTIRMFVNGVLINAVFVGSITCDRVEALDGSGTTVIHNGIWNCYYGKNDVFSYRSESNLTHKDYYFDDNDSASGAAAIIDITGECIVSAA